LERGGRFKYSPGTGEIESEMLQIEGLKVRYENSDKPVLDGVNLSLAGENAVTVGPNGSGKSTLFKAILGLAPISRGTVRINRKDVKEIRNDGAVSTTIADVYKLVYLQAGEITSMFADAIPLKRLKPRNIEEARPM
jgi:ABC-type Mn2+/Zn2+ transport system ATPase subunit